MKSPQVGIVLQLKPKDAARFWRKVDRFGPLVRPEIGRCWRWSKISTGYGSFYLNRRHVRPHRLMFEIHNGPITEGLVVMHACDNPTCVNPEHLSQGTHADNMADMKTKRRLGIENAYRQGYRPRKLTPAQRKRKNEAQRKLAQKNRENRAKWAADYYKKNKPVLNEKAWVPQSRRQGTDAKALFGKKRSLTVAGAVLTAPAHGRSNRGASPDRHHHCNDSTGHRNTRAEAARTRPASTARTTGCDAPKPGVDARRES